MDLPVRLWPNEVPDDEQIDREESTIVRMSWKGAEMRSEQGLQMIAECRCGDVNEWEEKFLQSIEKYFQERRPLSERQENILWEIYYKVKR